MNRSILEETTVGKKLVKASNYLNSWFDNKVFFGLSTCYFIAVYILGILEKDLKKITNLPIPNTLAKYTASEMEQFMTSLGPQVWCYRKYLGIELLLLFSTNFLLSFTISFFAFALVNAEEVIDQSNDKPGADPKTRKKLYPFRAILLNLLPFIALLIEFIENLVLLGLSLKSNDQFLLSIAPKTTELKWMFTRQSSMFTLVVFAAGWFKVLSHRLTNKKSEAMPNVNIKAGSKIPGLSRPGQISEETWK